MVMAEGAVCKEGKQKQNHKLQIESLLDGTVGTLDGPPPRSSRHLALHREREPTGFLWDGYGAAR